MKKIILWGGVIIVLGITVYYGRYFVFDTEVNEAAPEVVEQMEQQEGELGNNFAISSFEGSFTDVDRIHKGSGKALLVRKGDEYVLRFEDFRVTNGPDLYVWLTTSDQPTSKIESLGEYINLGKLKGNVGDQNYTFKMGDYSDKNLVEYDTVVIWCKQFSQLFSYANLK